MTKPQASSSPSSDRKKGKDEKLKKTLTANNPNTKPSSTSAPHGLRRVLLSSLLSDLSVNSSLETQLEKRVPRQRRFEPLRQTISYIERFLQSYKSLAGNISPPVELWSKKQYDGGVERLIGIARKFRYEGINLSHITTEFSTFMFYMDFNYTDLMELTEKMLSGMAKELSGSYRTFPCANGINKAPVVIDFTPPFRRISVIEELEKVANLEIPRDFSREDTVRYLVDACTKHDIGCSPPQTTARLLDKLVEHFLMETCVNPTFIIDYPEIMSPPSAKRHSLKPGVTECFQLFINKTEISNGYAAFNDPGMVTSGLATTGCWTLGIDRLAIMNTDWHEIKDKDCKKIHPSK